MNRLRRVIEDPRRILSWLSYRLKVIKFFWLKHRRPDSPLECRVPLGGLRIHVYPMDVLAKPIFMGSFEPEVGRFLIAFLRPGMVCIDIGANIGVFTLLMAELVGFGGQLHAFEPGPSEFEQLKANVALNSLTNVTLNPVAVCAENGDAKLTVCGEGWGAFNTLGQVSHPGVRADVKRDILKVPTVTLDSYIRDHDINRIDLVKVDVEGAELMVLQGARALLDQAIAPTWAIEVADATTKGLGYPAKAICDYLSSYGYTLYCTDRKTGEWHLWSPNDISENYNVIATKNYLG